MTGGGRGGRGQRSGLRGEKAAKNYGSVSLHRRCAIEWVVGGSERRERALGSSRTRQEHTSNKDLFAYRYIKANETAFSTSGVPVSQLSAAAPQVSR